MKTIAIILVAFSLSGCMYQSINQYDLKDAIKICGAIENIAFMNSNFSGDETVTCNNSTKTYLHRQER
jgi:hypothetical protein